MRFEKKTQKWLIILKECDIMRLKNNKGALTMLLEFSCSNHKSIKDKVVFSMIASKDTANENQLYDFGTINVLKNAVIYGANGSGKSNLIDAMLFMKNLVVNSINHQPGDGIRQMPHKLAGFQTNSTYSIQFTIKNIRYAFGFSLNNRLVNEEYLYYFPNGRQVKIYERNSADFLTGGKFKGKFDTCSDVLKPNRLLLSCAANFSSVQEISDVFSFFRDDMVVYKGLGIGNWMNYSLRTMNSEQKVKDAVMAFLDGLGTGIRDIKISIEKELLEESMLPSFLSDEAKAEIIKSPANYIKASVKYDAFEVDLMTEESTGVRKLFEFICPLIDIIIKGKVLICDELEANFHESIVCGLIDLFRQLKFDRKSQMIFTTHDTSILNLELFRRDQIWFTEIKTNTRSTDLYSLSEIRNVRKDENVEKGYISGKYGAIPMLNQNLAAIISKWQTEEE